MDEAAPLGMRGDLPLRPAQQHLPDELLVFGPEATAEVLNISRATLYRRVREGRFPHRRLGGAAGIRFTLSDIRQILAAVYVPASCPHCWAEDTTGGESTGGHPPPPAEGSHS